MKFPIKTFDRLKTFPVVLIIYGLFAYSIFYHLDYIQDIYLPFALISIISVLVFAYFGRSLRLGGGQNNPGGLFFWLCRLWLGLLGFIIIGALIQIILSHFNPYIAQLYMSNELYSEATYPLRQGNGILYWGFVAALLCWSLALSYVHYHKKGVPCAHRLAAPLWAKCLKNKKWSIWAKALGESHLSVVIMAWFGLIMLCIITLFSSAGLSIVKLPSYFKIPVISMSFFSIFFLLFSSSFLGKKMTILNRVKLDLFKVTLILGTAIISLLFFAGKTIQLVMEHNPDILKLVECDCTIHQLKLFLELRMFNLGWSIWVISLPLMGTFVARLSKGRSVLELMSGVVAFAVLLQIGVYFSNQDSWITLVSYIHETSVQIFLASFLAVFLFSVFFRKRNNWIFMNGFMPYLSRKNNLGQTTYPVSEVSLFDGVKIKGLGMATRKWAIMCLGLLIIHVVGGWQVVQLELGLFATLLVCFYFIGLVGFWVELIEDGVIHLHDIK